MKTFLRFAVKCIVTVPMVFLWILFWLVGHSILAYDWLFEIEKSKLDEIVEKEMKQDHIDFIKNWFTKI